MEVNNLSLAYLVAEMKPLLEGSFINKIQEVERGVFKFKTHSKDGSRDILAISRGFYLTEFKFEAPQVAHGYSIFLRKQLANQKIHKIEQHLFDRIILWELTDFTLVFELFGDGNIILLNKDNSILLPFKREKWKDREIKKGTLYEFPPLKKLSPLALEAEKLKEIFSQSKKNLFSALLDNINTAPVYLEEILKELKLKPEEKPAKLNLKQINALIEKITAFYQVDAKKLKPELVEHRKQLELVPFPLKHFKAKQKFSSLSQAFDKLFTEVSLEKKAALEKEEVSSKVKLLEFNLDQVLQTKQQLIKKEKDWQKKGDLIYAHFNHCQELLKALKKESKARSQEKEVMYKIDLAAKKGLLPKKFVKKIDLKNKRVTLNLE
jgi:predicted ribosome quality control (RQC) complex YloA/Tae2 family protein